ncbi:MAG: carboxypeptidase-like regulatory domain-containing protein, partial [Muribaculaceae bacterium]|nr:carboxypeptidase-like regulatory domain-containing protein [Muribaculaceae bacterium]
MKKSLLIALTLILAAIGALAQTTVIYGTVLSKTDNEPLIGASVLSSATKAVTAPDIEGNFSISVPQGSDLTISYE